MTEAQPPRIRLKFTPEMEALMRSARLKDDLNRWVFQWWVRRNEVLFHYRRMRDQHLMLSRLEAEGIL